MVVIVDYGMGNLGSILNMLKKIGREAKISSNVVEIKNADKLILPGVGAFDKGMQNLTERKFIPVLNELVLEKKVSILGICLGMQLFTRRSEEGQSAGLGWVDAETVKFQYDSTNGKLKIPHMGWNFINVRKPHQIFDAMYAEPRFYFVHSYHVKCFDEKDVLTTTEYGITFHSAIQKQNIIGVQFHPEKSHKFGMHLLKSFVEKM